jgi:hypothetical protein
MYMNFTLNSDLNHSLFIGKFEFRFHSFGVGLYLSVIHAVKRVFITFFWSILYV